MKLILIMALNRFLSKSLIILDSMFLKFDFVCVCVCVCVCVRARARARVCVYVWQLIHVYPKEFTHHIFWHKIWFNCYIQSQMAIKSSRYFIDKIHSQNPFAEWIISIRTILVISSSATQSFHIDKLTLGQY